MSTAHQGPAKARRYSAGILLFRRHPAAVTPEIDVLLGHMGGPLWRRRDVGAWSIPKGGYEPDEEPIEAARREFTEETGLALPDGDVIALGSVVQANNKEVVVWAMEGDVDATAAVSNTFELEWPPKSGRRQSFPEFDRIEWLTLPDAKKRLITAQATFLDRLTTHLRG